MDMIFIPKQTLKQDLQDPGQFCSKIFQDQFVILAQNNLKSNGHYDGYNRNVFHFQNTTKSIPINPKLTIHLIHPPLSQILHE